MAPKACRKLLWTSLGLTLLGALLACERRTPGLERSEDEDVVPIPDVPAPPADGPRLGALSNATRVMDRPSVRGNVVGLLHAGATVARAATPFSMRGCPGGWYPVHPRGFVCGSGGATTELDHPTLIAMALQPDLEHPLPYTYARAVRDTTLYEVDPSRESSVREVGSLRAQSGLAVTGSWDASDGAGAALRLAMTPDGRFVPTADLESATASQFRGVELGATARLPIAFVVKRGVNAWALRDRTPEKRDPLRYHARLALTGETSRFGATELWATDDGRWVRAADVTLVRPRHELPTFAVDGRKWLDVSLSTGAVVAYEGRTAVYATLVSAQRGRGGAPDARGLTERGEHRIVGKQVTALDRDPGRFSPGLALRDAPWVLELSSGQLVVGAYWHDRFGVEHGSGDLELSPADARRLFLWAGPALPPGWHAVSGTPADGETLVVVR